MVLLLTGVAVVAVWHSASTLVSINVIAVHYAHLLLGCVIVHGLKLGLQHFGI